jgi:hypothetical protein
VLRADGRMDDPRMLRIRDAYLEPFTSRASRKEPLRRVALARRTGCVTRLSPGKVPSKTPQRRSSQPRSSQSEDGCLSCSSPGRTWTNAAAPREKDGLRRGR